MTRLLALLVLLAGCAGPSASDDLTDEAAANARENAKAAAALPPGEGPRD